jgi:pantothenate kinase
MAKTTQHIAIDIGTSQLKIAFLEMSKAHIVVKKLITEDTTKVERDKLDEKVKEILKKSFTKSELSGSKVSLLLSYPFVEIKRL